MLNNFSNIIATVSLIVATSVFSPIASATQRHGTALDWPTEEETEKRLSEMKRVRELPVFQWLEAESEQGQLRSLKNTNVLFVGYMRHDRLTPEFLDDFKKYPIIPKLLLPSDVQTIYPIRIATIKSAVDTSISCAALIQIVGKSESAELSSEAEEMVDRFESLLPERPLDENCNYTDPLLPEGFEERVRLPTLFGTLLRERNRPCSEFSKNYDDHISLTTDMRFDVRLISVGDNMPRAGFHLPRLYFDFPITRGFFNTLRSGGLRKIQPLSYGNYEARKKDALLEYRVIEDEDADRYCYVLDIVQGDARRRFIMVEARDGSVLPWDAKAKGRGERHKVEPAELQRFGSLAANSLLVENGYNSGQTN